MQAIGQLAGGVAHEFNNMLQVITGFLSMAVDDLKTKAPEAVSDLTHATEAAMRASDLTRRLLAFSRRQVLNLEAVSYTHLDVYKRQTAGTPRARDARST